jgi:hypothetical protein
LFKPLQVRLGSRETREGPNPSVDLFAQIAFVKAIADIGPVTIAVASLQADPTIRRAASAFGRQDRRVLVGLRILVAERVGLYGV